jgi:hypothetical protein
MLIVLIVPVGCSRTVLLTCGQCVARLQSSRGAILFGEREDTSGFRYTSVYAHTHVCMYVYTYVYVSIIYINICGVCVCMYVDTYTCMVCVCVCVYVYEASVRIRRF